jgi:hypothetical protein
MDLIKQNDLTAFDGAMNSILDAGNMANDSASLRVQQTNLQTDLNDCMNTGDAAGVVRIQNHLRDLPILIKTAEIKEIRQNIELATARLAEIKVETAQLETVRSEKNKILAEKLRTVEEAGLAVRRVEFDLNLLDIDSENQRQARREWQSRLNNLTSADAQEQSRA